MAEVFAWATAELEQETAKLKGGTKASPKSADALAVADGAWLNINATYVSAS